MNRFSIEPVCELLRHGHIDPKACRDHMLLDPLARGFEPNPGGNEREIDRSSDEARGSAIHDSDRDLISIGYRRASSCIQTRSPNATRALHTRTLVLAFL